MGEREGRSQTGEVNGRRRDGRGKEMRGREMEGRKVGGREGAIFDVIYRNVFNIFVQKISF
jgi:hypothetical protein